MAPSNGRAPLPAHLALRIALAAREHGDETIAEAALAKADELLTRNGVSSCQGRDRAGGAPRVRRAWSQGLDQIGVGRLDGSHPC